MTRTSLRFLPAALAALLVSCHAVGPDYEPPDRPLPETFREADAVLPARPAEVESWWRKLEDPVLEKLVARAVGQGLDLREAILRVQEARALRGGAAAAQWPTLDFRAEYQRRGDSENTPIGSFAIDWDDWNTGFDAAWEVDLWGRVRRSIEAADADLQASIESMRAVAVTVTAETAVQYVQFRAFQTRTLLARNNITLQEGTLALVRTRFETGLVGERDVAQAQSNLQTTRALVPALEASQRAAENRLAVLLGMPPGALAAELQESRPIPAPPVEVAIGVPADLLRRRPDVRAAERELAAETARIGVAEAELYPQLSLLGSFGVQSDGASDLFEMDSRVYSFGPSLRWNLFDGGRLRNQVRAQDARAQQALVRWERSVLVALEETENAMTGFLREQARAGFLAGAVADGRRAVELAQTQYREGLTDFQNVLDSERALVELEDQLAVSRAGITVNVITLFKALGGGWEGLTGGGNGA